MKPSEGLAADVRRQLVGMLSAQGMSTRAIAPTVGVSEATAWRDTQVLHDEAPEPESMDEYRGRVLADAETNHKVIKLTGPESVSDPTTTPKVVGLDGKTYARPEPKTQSDRRAALPPMVQSAGWDLTKTVDRIQRLADDDRFAGHQKEMAPHLRSQI